VFNIDSINYKYGFNVYFKRKPLILDDDTWELFFSFPNQFPIIIVYFIIRRLNVSKLSIQVKQQSISSLTVGVFNIIISPLVVMKLFQYILFMDLILFY